MNPIGAQKIDGRAKKVTNEADWRPKNRWRSKKGHQWSWLASKKVRGDPFRTATN